MRGDAQRLPTFVSARFENCLGAPQHLQGVRQTCLLYAKDPIDERREDGIWRPYLASDYVRSGRFGSAPAWDGAHTLLRVRDWQRSSNRSGKRQEISKIG